MEVDDIISYHDVVNPQHDNLVRLGVLA